MARREKEITKWVEVKITKKVTIDLSVRLEAHFVARFKIMFNSRNVLVPPAAQNFEFPHQAGNFSVHEDIQVIHTLLSFKKIK
jgi:hypothetical protein